jgi:uncharacterized protein
LKFDKKTVVFSPYQRCFADIKGGLSKAECDLPPGFFGCPKNLAENDGQTNIGLILTRRCNLQCKYCVAHTDRVQEDIQKDTIVNSLKWILKIRQPREIVVKLSGGEPTQNWQAIGWVLEELDSFKGKKTLIIGTNGVMEKKQLDFLVNSNFLFHISLDGPPSINDYNRPLKNGRSSTKYTLKTIRYLAASGVPFKVRTIITSKTVRKMAELVEYFSGEGIRNVSFGTMGSCEFANRNNFLPPEPKEFITSYKDALDKARETGVSLDIPMHINLFNPALQFCPNVPGKEIIVTNEGNLSRCWFVLDESHPYAGQFIIGKYNPADRAIVKYEKRVAELNQFSVDKVKECEKCFAKFLCAGGCRARHMVACNSMNLLSVSDYYCEISKELVKDLIIRMYESSVLRP